MKIDTAVYPSYRKERGGGRKGSWTGPLGEKNVRERRECQSVSCSLL